MCLVCWSRSTRNSYRASRPLGRQRQAFRLTSSVSRDRIVTLVSTKPRLFISGEVTLAEVEELLFAELTDIAIRTIGNLARDGVFDHYVLASAENARWTTLGLRDRHQDTGEVDVSRELVGYMIRSAAQRLPQVFRYGGRDGVPRFTRIAIRLSDGDLLIVALRCWLNPWAARKLATAIERGFMPPRRPVVFVGEPASYVREQTHRWSTAAITNKAMALSSWQWRASRRLRLPAP